MATKKKAGLRITRIDIRNALGISELSFAPGKVTVISGANDTSKTSVLESILAVVKGRSGHDPTLLRQGAKSGEIFLLINDGEEIRKRFDPDGSELSIEHPDSGTLGSPANRLKALIDPQGLNPIEFLTAPAKTRVNVLLEALPMRLKKHDLAGITELLLVEPNLDRHAFDVLSAVRKDLFDNRTGINRLAEDKRKTAKELKRALPAETEEGGDFESLRQQQADHGAALERARGNLKSAHDSAINAATAGMKEKVAAIENELARKIVDLERWAESERDIVRRKYQDAVASENETRRLAAERIESEARTNGEELAGKVAQASERAEASRRATDAKRMLEEMEAAAEKFEARALALTDALKSVEDIKSELVSSLPIKGLEVRDGDLFLDGVPFDRVNEARKVDAAIEVAKLRAGELPLICVDGLECLDADAFAAFVERAAATELQFFVTRVTRGALQIDTVE